MFDGAGFQPLPVGIDEMPAGAALGAALASVDPARVSPYDTMRLVSAERRQLSHQEARFHTAAREAALADPTCPGGRADRDLSEAGDELRARLSLSRTAIATMLTLADATVLHPELGRRWAQGRLDQKRIEHIQRETRDLSREHAAKVIARVLPVAAGMPYGALIDRLHELAKAFDPEWAVRREENARRQRRVRATVTAEGTVNVCGLDLPIQAGTRMTRQINRLAARVKALGHPGKIDTIRGDVFTTRWDPALSGATDDEIVAAVLAMADEDDPPDRETHDPADAPPERPGDDAARMPTGPEGSGRGDEDDAAGGTSGAEPTGGDPASGAFLDGDRAGGDAPADPADDRDDQLDLLPVPGDGDGPPPDEPDEPDEPEEAPVVRRRGPRQSRFEVRVRLSTLLGRDEKPARLPGWGTIHAGQARELVAAHADAEWRVAVTDETGAPVAVLITRRRPTTCTTTPQEVRAPGLPRAVVEMHVSGAELDRFQPGDDPGWAAVITDLRHQHALWRAARAPVPDPRADTDAAADTAETAAAARRQREAMARFPHAALRRWLETRDETCVFPSCRCSAVNAEIDHTRRHAARGLTIEINLGAVCFHDHLLKEQPGWHLEQPRPGYFEWTSPTGHTYERDPQPLFDGLPDPDPPDPPSSDEPRWYATNDPIWDGDPYPRKPPPRAGPDPGARPPAADRDVTDDDPPPF
ncbi:HNH endonuclease signature motif containing protein [Actinomycetospora sp. NBRC 106375]|uniref:HNH endonuclease signature motif containing protein n=1 Tax=Actinomycetospora sp. NBRC 106375 TaxID=3032207 RepID=UPI002555F083|nr:HNH endonuclease signature motif containing protein [Actinomycetospora sp. NBRC 106375]